MGMLKFNILLRKKAATILANHPMSLLKKLFNPRRPAAAPQAKTRLVQLASAGSLICGEMRAKAAGYFGCELEGDLHADEEIWIEPGGKIRGDLRGSDFSIEGDIRGDIHASGAVALKTRARVRGDIHANSLSLETGAQFTGLLVIGGNEKSLALNLRSKS
jgi:cytoskeletal protein CcmA (bactofilin family)